MVQTLAVIKGGGGSIRVGTTGTISALMSRELDSPKPAACKSKPPSMCTFAIGDATSPKRLKSRTASEDAESSSFRIQRSSPEAVHNKAKSSQRKNHRIPILESDSDATPARQKMVEIVDIKCGSVEKAWTNPIKNRIKKLGFSKLSSDTALI